MVKVFIANSQIVFTFERNFDIRKRIFEFEEILKEEFYTPFQNYAIPDEIEPNIPRFEAVSKHHHSKLQVFQNKITLTTSYEDNYKNDFNEVENYVDNKYNLICKLIENEDIKFIAYIIELGEFYDENSLNKLIKENTGLNSINESTIDFSLLFSREFKNDFYLNINISKFRLNKSIDKTSEDNNVEQNTGLSVIVDINTKLHFNNKNDFDKNLNNKIKEEVFEIIKRKNIEDYLKGNL